MKTAFSIIVSILINILTCGAQEVDNSHFKNKYGIALTPTRSPNVYGICLGPIGSESICGYPYFKKSHGLNIQFFGQGILWMYSPLNSFKNLKYQDENLAPIDTLIKYDALRAYHNGLLISIFGAIDTRVNGLTFSFFYGQGFRINGLALNLFRNQFNQVMGAEIGFINEAGSVKGTQIGLINKTQELKGIQIGIWNVNDKRKFPLINW